MALAGGWFSASAPPDTAPFNKDSVEDAGQTVGFCRGEGYGMLGVPRESAAAMESGWDVAG